MMRMLGTLVSTAIASVLSLALIGCDTREVEQHVDNRELGKGSSLLADLAYRIEVEIARGRTEAVLAAFEKLAVERPLLDHAPLRELSDFHLYLAARWLEERGGRKGDVQGPLKRSYAELMRQTGFLAPAMRQRFLFQVPLHRAIVEAATRHGLSLPAS